jgi:DNA polymerase family B
LKPISIAGNYAYKIDPLKDDLYKRLIDLRSVVKTRMKDACGVEKEALDAEQQALKILANATSYGIFVELIVEDLDKKETRLCLGSGNDGFPVEVGKAETPGRYFHPLLATLITGAARLMLSITERFLLDAGLDWAFCDTDSMAIAKPECMGQETFFARVKSVAEWFTPLNPYEVKGPLLKIEGVNYAIGSKKLAPLDCLAISSKRYVLFNLDEQRRPIIRKASAHGLGHLIAPYGSEPSNIPAPTVPLSEIGVDRWQYNLWFQIVRAVLDGHPEQVNLTYHPALQLPAMSRYAVTTPALERWFKKYNATRPYEHRVKPFNFMCGFQASPLAATGEEMFVIGDGSKSPRKRKQPPLRPIAPYSPTSNGKRDNAAIQSANINAHPEEPWRSSTPRSRNKLPVEKGESRRVSAFEAILLQLWTKEISGDKRATAARLKYQEFVAQQSGSSKIIIERVYQEEPQND